MASVLVTGGAGYVGSVCCSELLRAGHFVTVVDDLSTGFREAVPPGAVFFHANIASAHGLRPLFSQSQFDAVFHFAAKALIPESVSNPGIFFQQNVADGIAFLELVRSAGIRKFVFSSSAAVYGAPGRIPIREEDTKNPSNSYGETKLMLERALHWYASAYGWSVVAMRYFNAAGATDIAGERHDPETHIIPLLLQTAGCEREFFTIYGDDYDTPDGTCVRDYVHVLDIAQAHIRALDLADQPGMQSFNIGTGTGYSVRQICDAVTAATGRTVRIRIAQRRPGDPPVLCASPCLIQAVLGWKPEHSSLEEIISSAWEWKQKQLGGLAFAAD
ncbi:MAG: UDP-glucose 4-epimerase GalE [Acidobacteria bacterium]|nr:MAG: UDP-glucose 4-epimerase GalE [Acidobacteriota bacterium]